MKYILWIIFIAAVVWAGCYFFNRVDYVETGVIVDEQSEQGDNRISATAAALVGNWRSTEDAKFMRSFSADGRFVDSYEGDPSATYEDVWSLEISEQDTILTMGEGDVATSFKILKVTPEVLELAYVGRDEVLRFNKVTAN